jgi:hypothetical protein
MSVQVEKHTRGSRQAKVEHVSSRNQQSIVGCTMKPQLFNHYINDAEIP